MNNYLDQFENRKKYVLTTKYYTATLFTDQNDIIVKTQTVEHLAGRSIEEVKFMYGENSVKEIEK